MLSVFQQEVVSSVGVDGIVEVENEFYCSHLVVD